MKRKQNAIMLLYFTIKTLKDLNLVLPLVLSIADRTPLPFPSGRRGCQRKLGAKPRGYEATLKGSGGERKEWKYT
jgi:hypothetical protein